jgi:hypothetical protein
MVRYTEVIHDTFIEPSPFDFDKACLQFPGSAMPAQGWEFLPTYLQVCICFRYGVRDKFFSYRLCAILSVASADNFSLLLASFCSLSGQKARAVVL